MLASAGWRRRGIHKTLTALLPAVTAALMGRPVHVVTVNDYLAERDGELLQPVYRALGLSTGTVKHGQSPSERRHAYGCDVTYCSNKELVFDHLRDRHTLGSSQRLASHGVSRLLRTWRAVAPTSSSTRQSDMQEAST